jgi:hypothetical protein
MLKIRRFELERKQGAPPDASAAEVIDVTGDAMGDAPVTGAPCYRHPSSSAPPPIRLPINRQHSHSKVFPIKCVSLVCV